MSDQTSSSFRRVFVFVVALFFINFIEMGVLKSFSILVDDIVFQLDTNLAAIGTIFGVFHGITYFLGPFIAPIVNLMDVSLISVVCAVGSLSLSLACLASDVIQFSMVCLLSGCCYSVVRLAGVILFYRNVRENFSITFGIADAGTAIGMMVVPILTEFFLEIYGWSGTILLLGGLLLQNSVFLLLMNSRPRDTNDDLDVQETSSSSVDSQQDDDVFDESDDLMQRRNDGGKRNRTTPLRSIWQCCHGIYNYFGLSIFFECGHTATLMFYMLLYGIINAAWLIFLIPHGVSRGYNLSYVVFLATCGGFGNIVGRVAQGPIVNRGLMTSIDLTIFFTILNAIVFLLDPLILDFVLLCIAAFLGGLAIGARTTLTVVITQEFFPSESFSLVYGLQSLFYSVGGPLGGILAGWLASNVDFTVSFMVMGGIETLTVFVLIITRCCIAWNGTK